MSICNSTAENEKLEEVNNFLAKYEWSTLTWDGGGGCEEANFLTRAWKGD